MDTISRQQRMKEFSTPTSLTYTDEPSILRLPNTVVVKTIIERVLQLCNIHTSSNAYRNAVNQLITNDKLDFLCSYLEPKVKEWIKLGNLYDDRKLVTKVIFQVSLSTIPHYFNPVKVYDKKEGYVDLLLVEIKPASAGAKPKRFVFEFKCKGVNF
ncbi:hypothetical protein BC937DRAFT_87409 [Endogone sp. FLAS-F59071]|nr:hypothetical protein BC937DRAFT_87409 [Endogone sp. FLAS-F59071]|eukprot:RUS12616.1 hypothetical protein BC937DRAFT_87409 [Endogone sp. FLAS-F59071]